MVRIAEIFEIIKIAFNSILVNKLRSGLASLGVVIGISFVILMGWILQGLDSVLEDTINIIGSDMLYVDKWDWSGGRNWKLMMARKPITLQQTYELCDRLKTAEIAVPYARKFGAFIKYEKESISNISIVGTRSEYGLTPAGSLESGRFFSKQEEQFGAKVVAIGQGVTNTLFKDIDPIGKIIKLDGNKFEIIRVLKKQGTVLMDFVDNQIFIPMPAFIGLFGSYTRSFSVAVKAGKTEYLDEVRAETEGLMREIRDISPGDENNFSLNETKAFESSTKTFRLYVWGIGIGMTVLSFIVGIIGIMNIMFVSVIERTKIGIRKAIGARKRSILLQFIVEAATLCFIGAFISFVGCSAIIYAVATILPKFMPSMSFLSPFMSVQLLIIATVVSIVVGMLAGLIPAIRAAKLDPVEALRFD